MFNSNKTNTNKNSIAIFGLLFGALVWGIIWYPYRLMAEAGVSGVASSFYTYFIATLLASIYFAKSILKHWQGFFNQPKTVIWIGLVAGCTNLSYVLAVIDGEVMRVMLLFYLSPLWTLLLARFWLKEPITTAGFVSIIVALIGAWVMLAGPFSAVQSHLPIPRNTSEWLALAAGIGFSLTNVITRKSHYLSLQAKSFAVWIGVVCVALLFVPFLGESFAGAGYAGSGFPGPSFFSLNQWLLMVFVALLLVAATMLVQFGVTQLSAIRASVLFLFELVVAAIASYYLAHEAMSLNEWIGGLLIITAAIISALNHQNH